MVNYQQVFDDFSKEIIQENNDTRNQRWENICKELCDDAVNIKFKLLKPKHYISRIFDNVTCDIVHVLDAVENALYCLSVYALNLCCRTHRGEYGFLKTYTGYFTANILSVMKGGEQHILELMGYQVKPGCENVDEFIIVRPSKQVAELAFELFLSRPYYRKMKLLCEEAINKKYDSEIIILMLLHSDIDDIVSFGVQDICENIKKQMTVPSAYGEAKRSEIPLEADKVPSTYHSGNKLVGNVDELNDDDLYGAIEIGNGEQTHSPKHFENPTFNRHNSSESQNTQKVITDDLFDKMKLQSSASKTIGSVREKSIKPPYPYDVGRQNKDAVSPGLPVRNLENKDVSSRTRGKLQTEGTRDLNTRHQNESTYRSTASASRNKSSPRHQTQNQYEQSYPGQQKETGKVSQGRPKQGNESLEKRTSGLSTEEFRRKLSQPNQRTNDLEHTTEANKVGEIQRKHGLESLARQHSAEEYVRLDQETNPSQRRDHSECRNQINEFDQIVGIKDIDTLNNEPREQKPANHINQCEQNHWDTEARGWKNQPATEEEEGRSSNVPSNTYNIDYITEGSSKIAGISNQRTVTPSPDIAVHASNNDHYIRMHGRTKCVFNDLNRTNIAMSKETFYTGTDAENEYVDITPSKEFLAEHANLSKEVPMTQQIPGSDGTSRNITGSFRDDKQRPINGRNTPTDETKIMVPPNYPTEGKPLRIPSIYAEGEN